MKTRYKSFVYIFLLGLVTLNSSCKKDRPDNSMVTDEAIVSDTSMVSDTETTNSTIENEIDNNDAGEIPAAESKSAKSNTTKNNSAKPPKNGGYSAPDGTDAENHDGDPYTKNNDKLMPSGSMK